VNFSTEVDALAARLARHALAFVSRKLFWRQIHFDPLRGEETVIRNFPISEHLLLVLICDLRVHLAGQGFGRFFRRDSDGSAGVDVDKGCGHFAPVAKLQGTFAQSASCDDADCVRGAAVDFNESDQSLAVFSMRIIDAELLQAEHGEAHAKNLPGANVSMSLFRVA